MSRSEDAREEHTLLEQTLTEVVKTLPRAGREHLELGQNRADRC
jgi:hypothetical protein